MTMQPRIVFDSWPLIAYLQGEAATQRVIDILSAAHAQGSSLAISTVNAGEVWYIIALRNGAENADRAIAVIRNLGIDIFDADWAMAKIAARYKTGGGISYADCFAAALAKQTDATLITGDREFKKVESEIDIEWL